MFERTGKRHYEAEGYRLNGELLLAHGASKAAPSEQSVLAAVDISRSEHAKSGVLKATTILASEIRSESA